MTHVPSYRPFKKNKMSRSKFCPSATLISINRKISWVLRLIPSVILGMALPTKISETEDAQILFYTLTEKAFGNGEFEAVARLVIASLELIAVIQLLA